MKKNSPKFHMIFAFLSQKWRARLACAPMKMKIRRNLCDKYFI
nr:MAG TPA: hypothetical protein [Caudoviricetes sp.]